MDTAARGPSLALKNRPISTANGIKISQESRKGPRNYRRQSKSWTGQDIALRLVMSVFSLLFFPVGLVIPASFSIISGAYEEKIALLGSYDTVLFETPGALIKFNKYIKNIM